MSEGDPGLTRQALEEARRRMGEEARERKRQIDMAEMARWHRERAEEDRKRQRRQLARKMLIDEARVFLEGTAGDEYNDGDEGMDMDGDDVHDDDNGMMADEDDTVDDWFNPI